MRRMAQFEEGTHQRTRFEGTRRRTRFEIVQCVISNFVHKYTFSCLNPYLVQILISLCISFIAVSPAMPSPTSITSAQMSTLNCSCYRRDKLLGRRQLGVGAVVAAAWRQRGGGSSLGAAAWQQCIGNSLVAAVAVRQQWQRQRW
jgi:hypothetical protein